MLLPNDQPKLPVLVAERWAITAHVGVGSGREGEEFVAIIRIRPYRRGETADATVSWRGPQPEPGDERAARGLAVQMRRLERENGIRINVAKPAIVADLTWRTPSATDAAIEAPGLS